MHSGPHLLLDVHSRPYPAHLHTILLRFVGYGFCALRRGTVSRQPCSRAALRPVTAAAPGRVLDRVPVSFPSREQYRDPAVARMCAVVSGTAGRFVLEIRRGRSSGAGTASAAPCRGRRCAPATGLRRRPCDRPPPLLTHPTRPAPQQSESASTLLVGRVGPCEAPLLPASLIEIRRQERRVPAGTADSSGEKGEQQARRAGGGHGEQTPVAEAAGLLPCRARNCAHSSSRLWRCWPLLNHIMRILL